MGLQFRDVVGVSELVPALTEEVPVPDTDLVVLRGTPVVDGRAEGVEVPQTSVGTSWLARDQSGCPGPRAAAYGRVHLAPALDAHGRWLRPEALVCPTGRERGELMEVSFHAENLAGRGWIRKEGVDLIPEGQTSTWFTERISDCRGNQGGARWVDAESQLIDEDGGRFDVGEGGGAVLLGHQLRGGAAPGLVRLGCALRTQSALALLPDSVTPLGEVRRLVAHTASSLRLHRKLTRRAAAAPSASQCP